MLKVKNIYKEYQSEKVLNKISFTLEREHKVALVGFNGTGKTTLLKIIAGEVKADKGKIEFNKNISVGSLPQDSKFYDKENVLEFLEDYVDDNSELFYRNIEIMFAGFGLKSETKNKKIGKLSSGQKTKVFLTALLLKKVDLMLLDEPTNNLDLPALIWLENFLSKTKSAFIVVSHDQVFLDRVANKIYEIDWKDRTLEISNGKYSDYLLRRQKEKKRQLLSHKIQKEDIVRLRKLSKEKQENAVKGSKYVGPDNDRMLRGYRRNKAGNSFKDSRVINNRIKRMDLIQKPNFRKNFVIEITPEDKGISRDILIKDLICGYDDFQIGPINLKISFGSKITILGLNGSGKTTLLKTITGRIPKIEGHIDVGAGVKFGNLMQEHESLKSEEFVFNFLAKRTKLEKEVLSNLLLHFGFPESQFKVKIKYLSPGGKARLLLAFFAATNVNVLVLDEPTNHLDMEAQEALEKTLKNFDGTVLTATHDRFFVKKFSKGELYVLTDGSLNRIKNFEQYILEMEKKSKKLLRLLKI